MVKNLGQRKILDQGFRVNTKIWVSKKIESQKIWVKQIFWVNTKRWVGKKLRVKEVLFRVMVLSSIQKFRSPKNQSKKIWGPRNYLSRGFRVNTKICVSKKLRVKNSLSLKFSSIVNAGTS